MKKFQITARTAASCIHYSALAFSSFDAALAAADLFGDEPCSISVKPLKVSR